MDKALIAYFSATGTTKEFAVKLADATNFDIFEIKAANPYTKEDLNWKNPNSRSSVEMKDSSVRPKIADKLNNIEEYDFVFLGFPIWWYREPSIIDTFLESYDFSGKTIIPFVTSGGSGLGETAGYLKKLAPDSKISEGRRFAGNVALDALKEWADAQL